MQIPAVLARSASCLPETPLLLYLCSKKDVLSRASVERIMVVSKQYGDDLYIELEQQQKIVGNVESVLVHRKCVDKYCHKRVIEKALREKARNPVAEDLVSKPKRARRSEQPKFFCFNIVSSVEKNVLLLGILSTQTGGVLHMFAGKSAGKGKLLEAMFEVCEKRNDTSSHQFTCSRCEISC